MFRRLFTRLDPEVLDAVIGAWMWTTTTVVKGRRVIAVDGKTIRGARRAGVVTPHLVAAFDHPRGVVIGQAAAGEKTNEIPTVRTLLTSLASVFDLAGTVVTIDAMHRQDESATTITGARADDIFTVKNNRPKLRAALKTLPWAQVPEHSTVEKTKGRRARRTIKTVQVPTWISFPGATHVAQLPRTVTVNGKKSVEVVYLTTSTTATPADLAAMVQGHWGDRKQAPLRPRRRLQRGRLPDPYRERTPGHGHPPHHRHRTPPPGRHHQHHHRATPPQPTTRQGHHPADLHKLDFAMTLDCAGSRVLALGLRIQATFGSVDMTLSIQALILAPAPMPLPQPRQ